MNMDHFIEMQDNLKLNILKDHFDNYGRLAVGYLEKANLAADKGRARLVDYWTYKALKCVEARDKIMGKMDISEV